MGGIPQEPSFTLSPNTAVIQDIERDPGYHGETIPCILYIMVQDRPQQRRWLLKLVCGLIGQYSPFPLLIGSVVSRFMALWTAFFQRVFRNSLSTGEKETVTY